MKENFHFYTPAFSWETQTITVWKNKLLGKNNTNSDFPSETFVPILKCQLGKKEQYVLCQTAIDRVEQKNEVCKEHALVL